MTNVHEKVLSEERHTFLGRIRYSLLGCCVAISSVFLGLLIIGISFPLICLFIGGVYGWAIARFFLVPPLETWVRKMGFSDGAVEKINKVVAYAVAALFALTYFGHTFLK